MCGAARGESSGPAIVFAADRAPAVSGEIYRLDATGRKVDLSRSPFQDTVPTVSPNGKLVAFASGRGRGGIYVVGIDGKRLRRLPSPAVLRGPSMLAPELAWAPNGELLAVVSGDGDGSTLALIGPGRTARVLAHEPLLVGPTWSPDSRLVTVSTYGALHGAITAFTSAGRVAWRVANLGLAPGWSKRGLFGTSFGGAVHVYDERGRQRFRFAAGSAAWSPDGTKIASIRPGKLEVRTNEGRLLLSEPMKGLSGHHGLVWIDKRRIVIGPRDVGVDTVTGKTFAGSNRAFGTRSADGRLVLATTRVGSGFAVQVSPVAGGKTASYGRVSGCYDDGAFVAAAASLQFVPHRKSLVYESYCAEPFAALYTIAADGNGLTRLTHVQEQQATPVWSPDGTRIAYARAQHTGLSCKGCPSALRVVGADGLVPRSLTNPVDQYDASPSWSPDSRRIAFVRSSSVSAPALFVISAAGGTPRPLHVTASDVAWGSARIAYTTDGSRGVAVWTARPDGSHRRQIASDLARADSLAWSRQGRLAWLEAKHAAAIVAGSSVRTVRLPFAKVASLAWSPDGTQFIVTAARARAAALDVWTVHIDGRAARRLTRNMNSLSASWR